MIIVIILTTTTTTTTTITITTQGTTSPTGFMAFGTGVVGGPSIFVSNVPTEKPIISRKKNYPKLLKHVGSL